MERLGAGQLSAGTGIAADASAGYFYVADAASDKIVVFAPEPPKAPKIETESIGNESAAVQGSVLGASEDGTIVYFAANGVLTSAPNGQGEHAKPGTCATPYSSSETCNLYERHGASTSFIATLSGGDLTDWAEEPKNQPTRVSGNGQWLELMSEARLTGYDNRDATNGDPAAEVFLYDAASNRLSCASCDPTGARPNAVEYHKLEPGTGGLVGGPRDIWPSASYVAANVVQGRARSPS